jgi:hypothetical protein
MTPRNDQAQQRVAVMAAPAALDALYPLLDAYARSGSITSIETTEMPSTEALREIAADVDAVLLVGGRRRSPRTVVPGPLLYPGGGRRVPIGWLPDIGARGLGRFAERAALLHRRRAAQTSRSAALLGQRSRRYRDLSSRIGRLLGEGERPLRVYEWTADHLVRDDMLLGLGCGLAIGLYVGHGRPVGWVGYRGTRAHHFEDVAEPTAAILSLTCFTASRKRVGLSFAEALPLLGAAGATFGAVRETLHIDNGRWALRLARGLTSSPQTLGELIATAIPSPDDASSRYRILGDPMTPLRDAPGAAERAEALTRRTVFRYAS